MAVYPLTIIRDRYDGFFSGAKYIAWNLEYYDIPYEASSNYYECEEFWGCYSNNYVIGKGATPEEALKDLERNIEEMERMERLEALDDTELLEENDFDENGYKQYAIDETPNIDDTTDSEE